MPVQSFAGCRLCWILNDLISFLVHHLVHKQVRTSKSSNNHRVNSCTDQGPHGANRSSKSAQAGRNCYNKKPFLAPAPFSSYHDLLYYSSTHLFFRPARISLRYAIVKRSGSSAHFFRLFARETLRVFRLPLPHVAAHLAKASSAFPPQHCFSHLRKTTMNIINTSASVQCPTVRGKIYFFSWSIHIFTWQLA